MTTALASLARRLDDGVVARALAITVIALMLVLGVLASHHSDALAADTGHVSVSAAHVESDAATTGVVAGGADLGAAVLLGTCVVLAICCVLALAILLGRWMLSRARAEIPGLPARTSVIAIVIEGPRSAPSLSALSVSRT